MQKIILGLVGDLAAGKGTIARYLHKKYGARSYKFSTMLRNILDRIYVEKTRENLQSISTFVRENYGQDVMSKVIARDVENDTNQIVVVDGIRRPTDITYLQELEGFHLIYITADQHIRWKRLVKRNENPGDDTKTFEQFCHNEQAEAESLIQKLGEQAEIKIDNNGDIKKLYDTIEEVIHRYTNVANLPIC
ncbi:MAG: AAA family ATPase [Candidatus Magasanikbacteria bacterium]|nr:AAA family ATPase [Candidatus Magasanikbacteria bacterium]